MKVTSGDNKAWLIRVKMPDGSYWYVPVMVVARDRAKHYAHEFDGDVQRSLDEDTIPLFREDRGEILDWACNNMNWEDVAKDAWQASGPKPLTDERKAQAWPNAPKSVVHTNVWGHAK